MPGRYAKTYARKTELGLNPYANNGGPGRGGPGRGLPEVVVETSSPEKVRSDRGFFGLAALSNSPPEFFRRFTVMLDCTRCPVGE